MSNPQPTSYDEVPYDSHPFPQTHPDHLATLAKLLGLPPAPVTKCRVLELGCASGGNLLPMADTLPESKFVGVDLSRVEIAEGQAVIADLGYENIEMRQCSILEVDDSFGVFDYIICHGVYSWVPGEVQDKILRICKENLGPRGIAYISYNTYPGWHMRGMIRDMLIYHTKQFSEAKFRVRQARNFLDFLGKAATRETTPYSLLLNNELDSFRRSSDSYLYHEHLEDVNEPIYFYQFAEKAAEKGLRYMAETDLRVMVPSNYPPEIANVLQVLAHDNIHMEQYMDFVRNTMFRQSLLCHADLDVNYNLNPECLTQFLIASPAQPKAEEVDLTSPEPLPFEGRNGVTLAARDNIIKAAMLHLSQCWPKAVPFETLFEEARKELGKAAWDEADERGLLLQTLLNCYVSASTSLVELHVHQPALSTRVTEKPCVSPLARQQASVSNRVTNLRHESIALGEYERRILQHFDGSHTQEEVAARVGEAVDKGEVTQNGTTTTALEQQLTQFARNGLLQQIRLC